MCLKGDLKSPKKLRATMQNLVPWVNPATGICAVLTKPIQSQTSATYQLNSYNSNINNTLYSEAVLCSNLVVLSCLSLFHPVSYIHISFNVYLSLKCFNSNKSHT